MHPKKQSPSYVEARLLPFLAAIALAVMASSLLLSQAAPVVPPASTHSFSIGTNGQAVTDLPMGGHNITNAGTVIGTNVVANSLATNAIAQARAASPVQAITTNGTSGPASFNPTTGGLNIPNTTTPSFASIPESANFTANVNGGLYNVTTGTSNIVVALPTTTANFYFSVRKADNSTGTITVNGAQFGSIGHRAFVFCDGTTWYNGFSGGGVDANGNYTFTNTPNGNYNVVTSGTGKMENNGVPFTVLATTSPGAGVAAALGIPLNGPSALAANDVNGQQSRLGLNATGTANAGINKVIYLAARTDGVAGSGTLSDPYDASTAAKLDVLIGNRYAGFIALVTNASNVIQITNGPITTAQLAIGQHVAFQYGQTGNPTITGMVDATHFTISTTCASSTTSGCTVWDATGPGSSIGTYPYSVPTTFYFAPGNYYTNTGVNVGSNWRLVGSGQGSTILHLQTSGINIGNAYSGASVIGWTTTYQSAYNVEVRDMTLDGGADQFAAPLTASFVIPATSSTVSCTVSTAGAAVLNGLPGGAVGYDVYCDNAADANGSRIFYGAFQITAISGTTVTLQSPSGSVSAFPANVGTIGTTVPATASLYLFSTSAVPGTAAVRSGLYLASGGNCHVENVTAQNVTSPIYENPVGIAFGGVSNSYGNMVRGCTVQNIHGKWPMAFNISSSNGGSTTVFTQCDFYNNTVFGDGYYDAWNVWQYGNSVIQGNRAYNVQSLFYCDTWNDPALTIEDNYVSTSFIAGTHNGAIYLQGNGSAPAVHDGSVLNNTIVLNYASQTGVNLNGSTTNEKVMANTIEGASTGGYGFYCTGISSTTNGSTSSGSTSLVLSNAQYFVAGEALSPATPGIAPGTTVSSVSSNTLTLSTATTATIASGTQINVSQTNFFYNNVVYSTITNTGSGTTYCAFEHGNTDQNGNVISLGFTKIPSSVPAGGVVYVSASVGSDVRGLRGVVDRPFATLTAAQTAASSGDTIYVMDGTFGYNGTTGDINLGKNGVNWVFEPGTMYAITNATNSAALFSPNNMSFSVTGFGQTFTIATTVTTNTISCVLTSNGNSTIRINNINFAATGSCSTRGIYTNGNSTVVLNGSLSCTTTTNNGAAIGIWCTSSTSTAVTVNGNVTAVGAGFGTYGIEPDSSGNNITVTGNVSSTASAGNCAGIWDNNSGNTNANNITINGNLSANGSGGSTVCAITINCPDIIAINGNVTGGGTDTNAITVYQTGTTAASNITISGRVTATSTVTNSECFSASDTNAILTVGSYGESTTNHSTWTGPIKVLQPRLASFALVAGTKSVSDTAISAFNTILLSGGPINSSTAIGALSLTSQTAGTGYTATSYLPGGTTTQTGDLRTVNAAIY